MVNARRFCIAVFVMALAAPAWSQARLVLPSSEPWWGYFSGNTFFFTADDGIHERELWRSDGTMAGTALVKDICPPLTYSGSNPHGLTDLNGVLFFSATDGTHSYGLWRSDGTADGTLMVKDVYTFGVTFTGFEDALYFAPRLVDGGRSLWRSDGSESGTGELWDPCASYPHSDCTRAVEELTVVKDSLFFSSPGPQPGYFGTRLWKTDGTQTGTVLVKDLCVWGGCYPAQLTDVGGTLFFVGHYLVGPTPTIGLWKSDGTESGTVVIKDFGPSPHECPSCPSIHDLTDLGGTLFFVYFDGAHDELWKSDGTAGGTVRVKEFASDGQGLSYALDLIDVDGTLFFTNHDSSSGRELWKSDGTDVGTVMVKDIWSGPPAGNPSFLTVFQDQLYFAATDGVHGVELWQSDGTEPGTVMVQDVAPGSAGDIGMIAAGPKGMFFSQRTDPARSRDLWYLPSTTLDVFRLYNDVTKEHLYTTDAYEYSVLGRRGWLQEGVAYKVLSEDTSYQGVTPVPLHRLYHSSSRQHLWTTDANEVVVLPAYGWLYEGVTGYVLPSAVAGSVPLYRLALADPPLHLWTTDENEKNVLSSPERGWIYEGIIGNVIP